MTKNITIGVSEEEYKRLKEQAESDYRTITGYVRLMVSLLSEIEDGYHKHIPEIKDMIKSIKQGG